jgi:hypothetical protein
MTELADKVMFFDGTNTGFWDNAGTGEDLGVDRPDTSDKTKVNISSAGGGTEVKGVVNYYLAELEFDTDAKGFQVNAESALSPPLVQNNAAGTKGIDAGTGDRILVSINNNIAAFQGKTFRVYRSFRDDLQGFDTGLLLTTDGSGVGSVTDSIEDEDLGNLPYAHGDPPPDGVRSVVTHFDRVFGLDGPNSVLYWTDLSHEESWWTEERGNRTPVMRNDGDVGTVITRAKDGIIVFKRHHMYKLRGRTPDQFYFDEITLSDSSGRNLGTPSIKSVVSVGSAIAFYYGKSVYIYTGSGTPTKISTPLNEAFKSIVTKHENESVALGYDAMLKHLWVSVPTGGIDGLQTGPDSTYIYDVELNTWIGKMNEGFRAFHYVPISHEVDNSIAAGEHSFLGEKGGGFFLATEPLAEIAEGGIIWRMNTVSGIETGGEVTFSPFYGRSPTTLKRFLYVDIVAESSSTNQELNFQWRADSENQQSDFKSTVLDLNAANKDRVRLRVNIGEICQALEMKFASSGDATDTPWKVYSVTVGYQEFESVSR